MPPSPTSDRFILARLGGESRFLRRRWLVAALLTAVVAGAAVGLAGVALDGWWFPVPERWAFALLAGAVAAALALLLAYWRWRGRQADARHVALQLEAARPELMDSLLCAVELAAQPAATRHPLHQALLDQAAADLQTHDPRPLVARRAVRGSVVVALLLLAVGFIAVLVPAPLTHKALAHARDLATGHPTGLLVTPGYVEIPRGGTLHLEADVRRGPDQVTVHLLNADGTALAYEMYRATAGRHSFDLYGVDQPLRYWITTPTLRSPAFRVGVFPQPEIRTIELAVQPPAYTGRAPTRTTELTDLVVPQGSLVTYDLTVNLPARVVLRPAAGPPVPFTDQGQNRHHGVLTVTANLTYHLVLDDQHGHQVESPHPYRIECLEDLPPVLQIVSPQDDAKAEKAATVPFAATASDDYGLRRAQLFYSVNGRAWHSVDLFTAAAGVRVTEQALAHQLALSGLVEYGDVVSYYLRGEDIAEPRPNVAATPLRFIEIRPRQPEPRESDGKGGAAGQLDVSDLIMRQKQLLRQTWEYLQLAPAARKAELLTDLARAGTALYQATQERLNDAKAQAAGKSLGPIGQLFDECLENLRNSDLLLRRSLPEDSLPFQQSALSRLVAIEIELQRNSARSRSASPEQGEGQPNPEVSEKNQAKERQEAIAELQRQLRRLDELRQRQENLNDSVRQRQGPVDPEFRDFTSKRQDALRSDSAEVMAKLDGLPPGRPAAAEVAKAGSSMEEVNRKLAADQPATAAKHGEAAARFLARARELVNQALEDLNGTALKTAAAQLDQVRQQQGEVYLGTQLRASGQAAAPPTGELAKSEAATRQKFEQVAQDLEHVVERLSEQNPGGAQQLAAALQEAGREQVAGKMKRAENALRYERLDTSLDYQRQVMAALEKLAKGLQNAAAQTGPALSQEELAGMFQKLLEGMAKVQEQQKRPPPPAKQRELAEQVAKDLQDAARRLNDRQLQELAGNLDLLGLGGGSPSADQLLGTLGAAARVLETKLLEGTVRQRLELSRLSGCLPPEEYRKLVNEYFRNLSDLSQP